ncbi:MAG: ABC transporter ATP-binding protein [Blautia hansenii]
MNFLKLENITYSYDGKENIFEDVNMDFEQGKIYCILGESGCGKTTLLSLLAGLDFPTQGRLYFKNKVIDRKELTNYRKHNVSIIFQNYNLIDFLNAKENVEIVSKESTYNILEKLGFDKNEMNRNILKLSGGQQQRVAVARALLSHSSLLLADEPTGNLDKRNAIAIAELLGEAAHKYEKCVIVVTHSEEIAKYGDVILEMTDGKLEIRRD